MSTLRSRCPSPLSRGARWWKPPGSTTASWQAGLNTRKHGRCEGGNGRSCRRASSGRSTGRRPSSTKAGPVSAGVRSLPSPKASTGTSTGGPRPTRPFNRNRFHYGWHFFLGTPRTADFGNTGVHMTDLARWGMGKKVHPVKVHCAGGYYLWDSDQETPNVSKRRVRVRRWHADGRRSDQPLYADFWRRPRHRGVLLHVERLRVLIRLEGGFAGEFVPRKTESAAGIDETMSNASFPDRNYAPGPEIPGTGNSVDRNGHFKNFIACVRFPETGGVELRDRGRAPFPPPFAISRTSPIARGGSWFSILTLNVSPVTIRRMPC